MKFQFFAFSFFLLIIGCTSNKEKTDNDKTVDQPYERIIENNIVTSDTLPNIQLKVADEFQYVGSFDFQIIAYSDEYEKELIGKPIAEGERIVFVNADSSNKIKKLFVIQLEGFFTCV